MNTTDNTDSFDNTILQTEGMDQQADKAPATTTESQATDSQDCANGYCVCLWKPNKTAAA